MYCVLLYFTSIILNSQIRIRLVIYSAKGSSLRSPGSRLKSSGKRRVETPPQEIAWSPMPSRFDVDRACAHVDTDMTCSICLGVLDSPVWFASCEHMFCDGCIRDWLVSRDTCPTCSATNCVENLTHPPRVVRKKIEEIELFCVYKGCGCHSQAQLQFLAQHEALCMYRPLDGHLETSVGQLKDEIAELRSHVHTLSSALDALLVRLSVELTRVGAYGIQIEVSKDQVIEREWSSARQKYIPIIDPRVHGKLLDEFHFTVESLNDPTVLAKCDVALRNSSITRCLEAARTVAKGTE